MPDSNQYQRAAENVFYRFEDQRYSVADEWGDHSYTSHEVRLRVYPVISYTPCGAWIGLNYTNYPNMPYPYNDRHICDKRFVNLKANKRFALPTIEEAIESYKARKARQISIYQARIDGANLHLEALKRFPIP